MITIKFKEADLRRYLSAIERVGQTAKTWGADEMQRRCAVDYYQLVTKNIMSRHLPRPAYSKRYRNWKYEYGWQGYPSPWRLKGDLVRSLGAERFSRGGAKGWYGGVKIGAVDSGGKSWFGKGRKGPRGGSKSIAMYGSVEEERRPVFGPSREEYAKEGWRSRLDETKQKMMGAWR